MKGVRVISLHYSADAEKAAPEWKARAQVGYPPTKWEREMELNAHAGALTAVFRLAYRADTHLRALEPDPGLPLRHGWDFGKGFPACVWFQRTRDNGLRVFGSLVGEAVQLRSFVERTLGFTLERFGDLWPNRRDYCDPAGNQDKDDGLKSVEVLRSFGWSPKWVGGLVQPGLEALERLMTLTLPSGDPAFLVDPRWNRVLIEALEGRYYRKASGEIAREHPWIDAMDALRYGVMCTKTPDRPRQRPGRPFPVNEVSGYGLATRPDTAGHVAGGPGAWDEAMRGAGYLVNGR